MKSRAGSGATNYLPLMSGVSGEVCAIAVLAMPMPTTAAIAITNVRIRIARAVVMPVTDAMPHRRGRQMANVMGAAQSAQQLHVFAGRAAQTATVADAMQLPAGIAQYRVIHAG